MGVKVNAVAGRVGSADLFNFDELGLDLPDDAVSSIFDFRNSTQLGFRPTFDELLIGALRSDLKAGWSLETPPSQR